LLIPVLPNSVADVRKDICAGRSTSTMEVYKVAMLMLSDVGVRMATSRLSLSYVSGSSFMYVLGLLLWTRGH